MSIGSTLGAAALVIAVVSALIGIAFGCLVSHAQKRAQEVLAGNCVDDRKSYTKPERYCSDDYLKNLSLQRSCEENLHCLQSKGYVVLKGFLDNSELASMQDYFWKKTAENCGPGVMRCSLSNANGGVSKRPGVDWFSDNIVVEPEEIEDSAVTVANRLKSLMRNISGTTDLKLDMLWPGRLMAFEADGQQSPTRIWHQDGDSYWLGWSTYHQVKFDIVVVKPNTSTANVDFVPFDVLRDCDRPFHDSLIRRGGASFFQRSEFQKDVGLAARGGRRMLTPAMSQVQTVRHDQVRPCSKKATYLDLDSLKRTPQLEEGDVLIYRVDIVHRTEWPGSFSHPRALVALYARHTSDLVDVLETLLAGGLNKFRQWPADAFQPHVVVCGLILSSFKCKATLAEIKTLADSYRQCEEYYMQDWFAMGTEKKGRCPLGFWGYAKALTGVALAKGMVRLNLFRLQLERMLYPAT